MAIVALRDWLPQVSYSSGPFYLLSTFLSSLGPHFALLQGDSGAELKQKGGALVLQQVAENGPADVAGISSGNIPRHSDGFMLSSKDLLNECLESYTTNMTVVFGILYTAQAILVSVTLGVAAARTLLQQPTHSATCNCLQR